MKFKIEISAILLSLMLPSIVFGSSKTVVVARGDYYVVWDKKTSPVRAEIVAEKVAATIQRIDGWDARPSEIVCEDITCLKGLILDTGSDSGVCVRIEEYAGRFTFSITTEDKVLDGEMSGSFSETLDVISDRVRELLPEQNDSAPLEPTASEPVVFPARNLIDGTDQANDVRLPAPFWVSFASTCALGAAALTMEILAIHGIQELRDGNKDKEYWESVNRLRVSSIVLTSLTGIGLGITGTVFYFARKKNRVTIVPVIDYDKAAVFIKGRF